MNIIEKQFTGDTNKKGKMSFIALTITLAVFFIKLFQPTDVLGIKEIYLIGLVFFVVSYLGMLWAVNFQVNLKSLLFVFPQSALFIFSEVMFVEMFFFQKFERLYEALLLLFILLIFLAGTYIVQLMANVFNVSSFREIPLQQVGKTTSFFLSVLMVYFVSYSILSTEINLIITFASLTVLFLLVSMFHLNHFGVKVKENLDLSITNAILMAIYLFVAIFINDKYEVAALAPTSLLFISLGLITNKLQNSNQRFILPEYTLIAVTTVLLIFLI